MAVKQLFLLNILLVNEPKHELPRISLFPLDKTLKNKKL